jgi:hypothetical protein
MNLEGIKEALLSPQAHAERLVKDKTNRRDRQPGMKAVLIFETIITGSLALLAWTLLGGMALLAPKGGWHWGWLVLMAQGLWASYLSPLALAWVVLQGVVLGIFGTWAWAEALDWCFKRLHQHKGGQGLVVFNAWILASLPWCVFLLIPVVGAWVTLIGGLWAVYQVAKAAYAEPDGFKVVVVGVLALIPATVISVGLALLLGLVARPVLAMDPLQAWLERAGERALAGPGDSMQSLGSRGMDDAQAAALASEALGLPPQQRRILQMVAAAQARDRAAATGRAVNAGAAPVPAPTAGPGSTPVGRAAAPEPAAAAQPTPASKASEPPHAPALSSVTPIPTSVAGAVAEQAGAEVAKAGVHQAAKLLQLFH